MAENKLTEQEKRRFTERVCETLLPWALREMFEDEIKNVWNAYVRSLCPDAPEDMFFTTILQLKLRDPGNYRRYACMTTSIKGCLYIDAPYIDANGVLDIDQCPCENLKMAVSAYLEFLEKRSKLHILLEGKLLTINTRSALKESLPSLYKYFDDGACGAYMPVAVDIDAIDCVVAV